MKDEIVCILNWSEQEIGILYFMSRNLSKGQNGKANTGIDYKIEFNIEPLFDPLSFSLNIYNII